MLDFNPKIEHSSEMLRNFGMGIMLVAILNFLAALAMPTVLKGATIAGGDFITRVNYINANTAWVQLGWAAWICATLSLQLFFYLMSDVMDPRYRTVTRYALYVSLVGAASDSLADLMSLGIIPDIAARYVAATEPAVKAALQVQFETWDRFSVLCTGGLGNTCYGLAGCLLTFALFRSGEFSAFFKWVSLPLWAFTFLMSYGSFAMSGDLLPFAVGSTMATFILWCFLIGFTLWRKGRQ